MEGRNEEGWEGKHEKKEHGRVKGITMYNKRQKKKTESWTSKNKGRETQMQNLSEKD